MRLTRLAVPIVAAALLVTAAAGPATAATRRAVVHLRPIGVPSALHGAADMPYGVFVDTFDCYLDGSAGTVVGDLRNLTDAPVRKVIVTVTLKDNAGNVRATATGSPLFEFVDPGEYTSFRIDLTNATGASKCSAKVTDYTPTLLPANQYFTASNVSGTDSADGTVTHLRGTLANDNTVSASGIVLVATLYDKDGNVTGVGSLALNGGLTPGGTTAFTVDVEHRFDADTSKYQVQAESTSDPQTATTMDATPNEIVYGSTTAVSGKGVPGNPVRVQEWDQPSASWIDLEGDLITADNGGAYALQLSPDWTTTYRTLSGSVTSVPVVLFVDAHVTMKASTKKSAVGKKVVLSGIAEPLDDGSRVVIQRKVGSSWKTVATVGVSGSGQWSYAWKPAAKGTYVLRAWVDDQTHVFSGNSAPVTIAVR